MNTEFDTSQPIVLLIGTLDSEGVLSALKATGRQYKIKRLDSKPENWGSIIKLFKDFEIKCAVVKLTGFTYEHLVSSAYEKARRNLFEHLAQVPHAVFIHEELFLGYTDSESPRNKEADSDYADFIRFMLHQPKDEVRKAVNDVLAEYNVNVLPYASNAELTVMASAFITESEEGLLFRLYVPSKRMWANETERLIQLFRDYLGQIGQLSIRLDQHRTKSGTVFEFFANEKPYNVGMEGQSLATQFQEFSKLLDLSVSEPNRAEAILRSKRVDPREIVPILTRYAKEAKRLQTDLKHEREQKILSIQQRLESELVDTLPANINWDTISALVHTTVPNLSGISSALNTGQSPLQLTSSTQGGHLTINLKPQIVQAVNSIVAQEIEGNVYLTEQDKEILQLIREHAPEREPELSSAVYELADGNVPQSDRLIAKQRLKAFLLQVGTKAGDIATGLLQTYIEQKLGLS